MSIRPALSALVFLPALISLAHADTLVLVDGRILNGPPMERVEGGIRIRFRIESILVPTDRIHLAALDADSDAEAESRKRAVEEILSHRIWRNRHKLATKHFRIEHTLPPILGRHYADLLDAVFEVLAETMGIEAPKRPLAVCLYGSKQDFLKISGAPGGSTACFKFTGNWEIDFHHDPQFPRRGERTAYHMVLLYALRVLGGEYGLPDFPAEGLADYYEASRFEPDRQAFVHGLPHGANLEKIGHALANGNVPRLREIIQGTGKEEVHAWSWSVVHFLLSGEGTATAFWEFLRTLARGEGVKRVPGSDGYPGGIGGSEVLRVFRDAFGLSDEEAFLALERRWLAFAHEDAIGPDPDDYAEAARTAESYRRLDRARILFEIAVARGSTNSATYARLGRILMEQERVPEAISIWRKGRERDPLDVAILDDLWRSLREHDQHAVADRVADLAGEIREALKR